MMQNVLEKLQLKEEKNLLIQGLPSSIEKQFVKLSYAKNVTPLLKSKKIDFALIFALSSGQLKGILKDVLPALHGDGKFWIAYPKASSKIATDLKSDCKWDCVKSEGFESITVTDLDHVWTAVRFTKVSTPELISVDEQVDMVIAKAVESSTKRKTSRSKMTA